jgi:hypothetical protein
MHEDAESLLVIEAILRALKLIQLCLRNNFRVVAKSVNKYRRISTTIFVCNGHTIFFTPDWPPRERMKFVHCGAVESFPISEAQHPAIKSAE